MADYGFTSWKARPHFVEHIQSKHDQCQIIDKMKKLEL